MDPTYQWPEFRGARQKDQTTDYRTSALAAPQARRLNQIPDEAGTPIIYAAICAKCSNDGQTNSGRLFPYDYTVALMFGSYVMFTLLIVFLVANQPHTVMVPAFVSLDFCTQAAHTITTTNWFGQAPPVTAACLQLK